MNLHSHIGIRIKKIGNNAPTCILEWMDFILAITLMALFVILPGAFIIGLLAFVWKKVVH